MKTVSAPITFHSNEYIELPDMAVIELSKNDLSKISLAKDLIKKHGFESISIPVCAQLMEDGKESQFRQECEQLRVTSYGIYYYAQNKWDASAQIEADSIEI